MMYDVNDMISKVLRADFVNFTLSAESQDKSGLRNTTFVVTFSDKTVRFIYKDVLDKLVYRINELIDNIEEKKPIVCCTMSGDRVQAGAIDNGKLFIHGTKEALTNAARRYNVSYI